MPTQLLSIFSAVQHCAKEPTFFGLKPWFHYLRTDSQCNVIKFGGQDGGDVKVLGDNFGLILLAIIDDLLRIGGLVAIGFIIYGGILYVTSQGSPDQTQKAQSTIQNALIGLIISILAVTMVSFIGNKLG